MLVSDAQQYVRLSRPGAAGRTEVTLDAVSYTHLRAHETVLDLVCRLLLEKNTKHPTDYNSLYTAAATTICQHS